MVRGLQHCSSPRISLQGSQALHSKRLSEAALGSLSGFGHGYGGGFVRTWTAIRESRWLYALAGIPLDEELPSPTFEVFDPSTQQWSPLPPPPFFNLNQTCCFAPWHDDARACFDYVVMDSKISVCGPFSVGYTFDIPTKKWIHCLYFGVSPSPFPFAGMGLMIKLSTRGDKAIIGHEQLDNCLRAYFLHYAYGHCQSVPIPVDIPPEFAYCRPNFFHLGDGIICVVMAVVVAEFEELRIFVATFQVSRVNRQSIYLDLWENHPNTKFSLTASAPISCNL
nr:hypothetical protein CFP56_47270 [Quercus suber]